MKYIRTKDEIVDISNYIKKPFYYQDTKSFYYQDTKSPDYIGKEKIIKEADTIEELCDEFVVVHKDGTPVFQKSTAGDKVSKEYVEYLLRNNQTFYGAIWTDKGLIYVAKMNDKGELELI